jgi:hypothetical protein
LNCARYFGHIKLPHCCCHTLTGRTGYHAAGRHSFAATRFRGFMDGTLSPPLVFVDCWKALSRRHSFSWIYGRHSVAATRFRGLLDGTLSPSHVFVDCWKALFRRHSFKWIVGRHSVAATRFRGLLDGTLSPPLVFVDLWTALRRRHSFSWIVRPTKTFFFNFTYSLRCFRLPTRMSSRTTGGTRNQGCRSLTWSSGYYTGVFVMELASRFNASTSL